MSNGATWVAKKIVLFLVTKPITTFFTLLTGVAGYILLGAFGALLVLVWPGIICGMWLVCDPPEGRGWAIKAYNWAASSNAKEKDTRRR